MNELYSSEDLQLLESLPGPILVVGAGGFIGRNVFDTLIKYRDDVFGIGHNSKHNSKITLIDITNKLKLQKYLSIVKPKAIFNFASYGNYSWQTDTDTIYQTNLLGLKNLIEIAKVNGFNAFINAGTSSEYGINSNAPQEDTLLTPNSHYAVSKGAAASLLYYYGKTEKLPVSNLRLYAVYGPYENEKRLISSLMRFGATGKYPSLANPKTSRDFIYISDVVRAFIYTAAHLPKSDYGTSINIGTGKATSLKTVAMLVRNIYKIKALPKFSNNNFRAWETNKPWKANVTRAKKVIKWEPKVILSKGLKILATTYYGKPN